MIIYTQLIVIKNQHIWDLDDAAVSSDVGGIRLPCTAECTALIAESKLLHYLEYLGAMVDLQLTSRICYVVPSIDAD